LHKNVICKFNCVMPKVPNHGRTISIVITPSITSVMDGVITNPGLMYKFISTLLMLCHFKNLDGSYCKLFRTHLWMDPINGGPAKLSLMLLCENGAKYYISVP